VPLELGVTSSGEVYIIPEIRSPFKIAFPQLTRLNRTVRLIEIGSDITIPKHIPDAGRVPTKVAAWVLNALHEFVDDHPRELGIPFILILPSAKIML